MNNIIEIEHLSKQFKILNKHQGFIGSLRDLFSNDYRIVKAVDDISFSVGEGEMIGFIGPNGAGKSTTIKMMTGVLKPNSGKLLVNGYVPWRDRTKYVGGIGVVFGQRTQLWWELPVIESFKILKEIYRINNDDYAAKMKLFEDLMGIDKLYPTPVRNLSLGQRMLCDITASFLHNPKVIFLDEPTIGLDVSIKNKIRELIKQLNEALKVTVILTTHDMNDIEELCKRVILIDKGKLLFDGDIQKILRIFGSYRILKIDFQQLQASVDTLNTKLQNKFPHTQFQLGEAEDGWLAITFNQDDIKLMELLGYLGSEFSIKDIKVEEIELESIIKRIYEGGLN
ncbi:MAG TPA: ATP-binding cassette domain-containing protein [Bacillota bacterium]|nr:ATP-binding cassette domain-containing protein [Bacillota bacterium]